MLKLICGISFHLNAFEPIGCVETTLFGKRPSPYYAKNSSNKQRETTVQCYLRHEGQSIWNISRTLKVSSSAVAKNMKRYDETGSHEEDPE